MIQKKYLCKDFNSAENVIPEIHKILRDTSYKAALITFYESGLSVKEVESLTERIKEGGFPSLYIAGISMPLVAENMPEGKGILLNLVLTFEAGIDVVTIPCVPGEEDEAALTLNRKLDSLGNVKAVELFGSNMSLDTTRFMEKSMEGFEEAALFGTTTLRNLAAKLSVEDNEQVVEIEQGDSPSPADNELIVGDRILNDGFVAVVFYGEKLSVEADYALGWSPIGRRLFPELGTGSPIGETVIKKINSLPAVDIYREYLGVYPDAFLISNICEFPLMVERDGINICLIPITAGRDGELYFMMTLGEGEHLRLSFASHDEVLYASRKSLDKMERFQPEALFLTLCGNRINFLKEDAHLEWDGFNTIGPDHALMHGACELFYHKGRGGILNSAHLAIGFREKEAPAESAEYVHPDVESLRKGRVVPLSDRMSAFLRRITSELQEAASEAKDANNAKSAFLSHMSHEIRTPINAILGMDEMILRESSEEDILGYADDIRSAGNNLLGIINDVLDFSKIEAGRMSIIPVEYEIASLLNDLYNAVRMRAENKGLSVKLDIDPSIPSLLFGDETRLKQAVTNLLTNAVKYTENGSVTLSIKKIPEGEKDREALMRSCPGDQLPESFVKLSVKVKDTGIGIRPEDMEKLFTEFERVDEKRNRRIEGTGLGLNITRHLLELMGSALTVESGYGEGSVFGFEILQGVLKDEPLGEFSGRIKKTDLKTYRVSFIAEDSRILVVDDTKVNLDVIKNLLKKTRIEVHTAGSGEEALELIRKYQYDVILLDHLMPVMDGIETLKRMKGLNDSLSHDAPVISLTANALAGARDQYLKEGFKDYLSKPVNPKELEDMLFKYIPPEKIRTLSRDEGVKNVRGVSGLPKWLLDCSEIDVAEGLKNCGSKENYQVVLECFAEIIEENANEIEDYYHNKDWENYTIKVHALKSSSKLIGASDMSLRAAALEDAGHKKDIETIERDTESLLSDYRALREVLTPPED